MNELTLSYEFHHRFARNWSSSGQLIQAAMRGMGAAAYGACLPRENALAVAANSPNIHAKTPVITGHVDGRSIMRGALRGSGADGVRIGKQTEWRD